MKHALIYQFTMVSNLLPVGATGLTYRKFGRAFRFLFFYFVAAALSDFISYLMSRRGIHNLWLLDVYHIVEFVVLTFFLRGIDVHGGRNRIYAWALGVYFVLWIISKLTVEPFFGPSSLLHAFSSGVLSIFAIRLLVGMMKEEKAQLTFTPQFVGAAFVFVYFASSIIMFGSLDAMIGMSPAQFTDIWVYHWFVSIATNIAFTAAYLWTSRNLIFGGTLSSAPQ